MNYSARLKRRTVKQVGSKSRQADVNVSMQLAAMQCERRGHVPGKRITAGAYHNEYTLCKRCMRMVLTKDNSKESDDVAL